MSVACNIEFENNPLKVVCIGQLLRGNVHLSLTETVSVQSIFLEICGNAYSCWTNGFDDDKKTFRGKENYLNERIYLLDVKEGEIHLTPGSYSYTFECMLPPELPASFEGGYGNIRYTACVFIGNPLRSKKRFEVTFTVVKSLNLTSVPASREPVIAEEHKTFYPCFLLCCCESDPLDIKARVPVGGYTPGQNIEVKIEVDNKSDQPVTKFTVQLIKKIRYHTSANRSASKLETVVVSEEETRGCDLSSEVNLRVNIIVPSISPTDNTTSNIIKVEYSVRIIGSVVGCHTNPTLDLPIVIGSIPIADNPSKEPMNSHSGKSEQIPPEQMPRKV